MVLSLNFEGLIAEYIYFQIKIKKIGLTFIKKTKIKTFSHSLMSV